MEADIVASSSLADTNQKVRKPQSSKCSALDEDLDEIGVVDDPNVISDVKLPDKAR